MRPTTKDLARAAGVSLATVDRVLNARPNVSSKTVRKVNEAIDRIGFVRNHAAASLARNKVYNFRFLFPAVGDQYLSELLDRVEEASEALRSEMISVEAVRIPMTDPHATANYISSLASDEVDGIAIMAPESPQVRDAMARLPDRGIKAVQFLSGQEKLESLDFTGIDNVSAGATAGRIVGRFLGDRTGKIMVVAETLQSMGSIERRLGFDSVINADFPNLKVLPSLETHGDERRTSKVIARTMVHQEDIVAIYVMGSEARIAVSKAEESCNLARLTVVAHERTPFSEDALKDGRIDAIIAQNPGHAVRSAIRTMRARSSNTELVATQEKIRIEILLKDNL